MKNILVYIGLLFGLLSAQSAVVVAQNQTFGKNVVVSIKPIHSLVAGVMKGVGEPYLIVRNASSPHTYRLRPSDGQALSNAAIVFWVGPNFEQFLKKPISSFAKKSKHVALINNESLVKYVARQVHNHGNEGHGAHEKEGHDAHEEEGHGEHKKEGHGAHEEEGHGEHKKEGHGAHEEEGHGEHKKEGHGAHEEKGHGEHVKEGQQIDQHIWLDPENAKKMVKQIAKTLIAADPENAKHYQKNALAMDAKLDALSHKISAQLKNVQRQKFLVFHDAYQYFEKRFQLNFSGSVIVNEHQMIGARQLAKIQDQVKTLKIRCIFSEPQFNPRLVKTVSDNQKIKLATLDPIGAPFEPGEELYFGLMASMASSFKKCFE